jgi:hypothetical protein
MSKKAHHLIGSFQMIRSELLIVLQPEIPLPNNGSESDVRCRVTSGS